uniref:Ig-like domain-containing protein n=1 Tax=Naja naja TaxID=35670 RepID=A0A8C6XFM9_NAJNA
KAFALPLRFQEELKSQEVLEGRTAILHCALNRTAMVDWRKDAQMLQPSAKYKIKQKENVAELTIQNVTEEDAGEYSCICEDQTTSASVTVQVKSNRWKVRRTSRFPLVISDVRKKSKIFTAHGDIKTVNIKTLPPLGRGHSPGWSNNQVFNSRRKVRRGQAELQRQLIPEVQRVTSRH